MRKNIEPGLKKIGDYLSLVDNATFIIPEYQRAYSWELKHCEKLWQDLENFINNNGTDPYFFGTIIINCQEGDTKLVLIDGQQRTTTFILLFKALLIRLNQAIEETEKDEDSRGLARALKMKRDRIIKMLYKAKDEEIDNVLKDYNYAIDRIIVENHSINELYKEELIKILNSENYIVAEDKVEKIKYKQKDNRYTNYFRNFKYFHEQFSNLAPSQLNTFAENILEKTEIIEIRSWNVEQAITMFNSLNSDGMPLLDADIISAKLYSNSGDDRSDFNTNWEELKKIVAELESKKIVGLDTVLMQYMYIKRALDKEYISKDSGAVNVTTPGLRRYYTDLNKTLLESPLTLTAKLLKIAKIWEKISDYSIVKLCFKFNENIKLYLISYLNRYEFDEINENLVEKIAQPLLKLFSVLEVVDIGYSSSKFKTFLFGLNIKLVDINIDLEEIITNINNHIADSWKKEDIESSILDYNNNPLVYLDEYIFAKENNKKFTLPDKYDIEHIMPKSGQNIEQIRLDADLVDNDEFLSVVNKLGNKILLEENINRSIGNAWFRTKIQSSIKEKQGYKDSIFLLSNEIVKKYQNEQVPIWKVKDIKDRTIAVSKRILNFIFSNN